jgi:hypothetical protein
MTDIFEKTLTVMPLTFSSTLFIKEGKRFGINRYHVENGHVADFLRTNTKKVSRRMHEKSFAQMGDLEYERNYAIQNLLKEQKKKAYSEDEINDNFCIAFLKAKGYKIFKTTEV